MEPLLSSENLSWFIKLAFAQILILFVLLLDFVNFSTPFNIDIKPYFMLLAVFFWSIYRPSFLLPLYVFALGILYDMVLGYPIGLHSLLFITMQLVLRAQRLFFIGQPFLILWMSFALTSFIVISLEWVLFIILRSNMYDFSAVILSTASSIFIFPLVIILFNMIQSFLPPVKNAHFI